MEKDLQTISLLSKASAIYSLSRELATARDEWSRTHKEPMDVDNEQEILYLTSESANILDMVGREMHDEQQDKVKKMIK